MISRGVIQCNPIVLQWNNIGIYFKNIYNWITQRKSNVLILVFMKGNCNKLKSQHKECQRNAIQYIYLITPTSFWIDFTSPSYLAKMIQTFNHWNYLLIGLMVKFDNSWNINCSSPLHLVNHNPSAGLFTWISLNGNLTFQKFYNSAPFSRVKGV